METSSVVMDIAKGASTGATSEQQTKAAVEPPPQEARQAAARRRLQQEMQQLRDRSGSSVVDVRSSHSNKSARSSRPHWPAWLRGSSQSGVGRPVDLRGLRGAIGAAEKANVDDAIVASARELLGEFEEEQRGAVEQLRELSGIHASSHARLDMKALGEAIAKAKAVGVESGVVLEAAERARTAAKRALVKAPKELRAAVNARPVNIERLQRAIDAAVAVDVCSPEELDVATKLLRVTRHDKQRRNPKNEFHKKLLKLADEAGGLYKLGNRAGDASRFLVVDPKQLVFGKLGEAARGVELYMNVTANGVRSGMNDGVEAIRREVEQLPDGKQEGYWNAGSVVKECLKYVLEKEAGSSDISFQGGLKRDCDRDGNLLPSRRHASGRGLRLADFLAHPVSVKCGIEEAEVAGMRLYSTAAYEFINNPLRDQDRRMKGEPHPLPVTVAFIREGLKKLRGAERLERANLQVDLYRGMKNVSMPDEFLSRGGTELAPMSTTSNLAVRFPCPSPLSRVVLFLCLTHAFVSSQVAMEYSASPRAVLLRLRTEDSMTRGPDISFLSAFPGEDEFLFPPLTYLSPTGETQTLEVDDAVYHVIDVKPRMS